MNNIFFDLDGTIINSEKGIMGALKYMYTKTDGFVPHDDDTLRAFIGPTLSESLKKYDNLDFDNPLSQERFKAFKEYYQEKGVFDYSVYDGVYEMMENLKSQDKEIFIATSKPEVEAKKIIDQLDMKKYIRHVFGATDDEKTRSLKADVISYGMRKTSVDLNSENLVMVGDRSSDIIGAHQNDLKAIGVTYGFGNAEELSEAHSEWIVNSPLEVPEVFKK
ncbi:HAD hydrolase-like protein [Lactobacillus terrae]|uniref:HAD hydrolase-like protein n=1 Tax=Lactobacillus terrae TaxID=2269374 RepID=UPI000C1B63D3|nr:HAD hydrolase-like protein [Lactobacillus terrae]